MSETEKYEISEIIEHDGVYRKISENKHEIAYYKNYCNFIKQSIFSSSLSQQDIISPVAASDLIGC